MTKSEILAKMKADLETRGKSEDTIRSYCMHVRLYQDYHDKPADQMGETEAHADVILGGYAALCRQAVPVMNGIDEAELRAVLQEIDKSKRLLKSLYESCFSIPSPAVLWR